MTVSLIPYMPGQFKGRSKKELRHIAASYANAARTAELRASQAERRASEAELRGSQATRIVAIPLLTASDHHRAKRIRERDLIGTTRTPGEREFMTGYELRAAVETEPIS